MAPQKEMHFGLRRSTGSDTALLMANTYSASFHSFRTLYTLRTMRIGGKTLTRLLAVLMLLVQAGGLHAHAGGGIDASSVKSHLQAAVAHADTHGLEHAPQADEDQDLFNAALAKVQGGVGWVLPAAYVCAVIDDRAASATPEVGFIEALTDPESAYSRPPARAPPANA